MGFLLHSRLLRGVGKRAPLGLYSAGPGDVLMISSRCAGAEPNDQRGLVGLTGESRWDCVHTAVSVSMNMLMADLALLMCILNLPCMCKGCRSHFAC
jgi:hypothetical protein